MGCGRGDRGPIQTYTLADLHVVLQICNFSAHNLADLHVLSQMCKLRTYRVADLHLDL